MAATTGTLPNWISSNVLCHSRKACTLSITDWSRISDTNAFRQVAEGVAQFVHDFERHGVALLRAVEPYHQYSAVYPYVQVVFDRHCPNIPSK
jgi:hypothetical protein